MSPISIWLQRALMLNYSSILFRRVSDHKEKGPSEELFIDSLLTRHAQKLLSAGKLKDLGYFAAYLDFHLVNFFTKERFVLSDIFNCMYYYYYYSFSVPLLREKFDCS